MGPVIGATLLRLRQQAEAFPLSADARRLLEWVFRSATENGMYGAARAKEAGPAFDVPQTTLASRLARAGLPSVRSLLVAVRMILAADLREAGYSMVGAADWLGYSSESALNRAARSVCGMPRQAFASLPQSTRDKLFTDHLAAHPAWSSVRLAPPQPPRGAEGEG